MKKTIVGATVLLLVASASHASVVADNVAGNTAGMLGYYGQSFTISGTGEFNNLAFNFFQASNSPLAAGTAFIFESAYTGKASDLSAASPGLLARSTSISGNVYDFGSAFNVSGGQQYFLYTNALLSTIGAADDNYAGGNVFYTSDANSVFGKFTDSDANFRLTAAPFAAVPEPATWAMFIGGFGLIGGVMRRRQKTGVSFA